MPSSDQILIERLQERNADRQRATDGGLHSKKALLPVSKKALQASEQTLGFKLPALLRDIYLRVGNGGFGPSYGIVGLKGGARLDGVTLESGYQKLLKLERENSVWRWPAQLLPVGNNGCGMWSCVDCTYQRLPMILWDPNPLEADFEGADARHNWGYTFWDQGESLKAWLTDWLDEQPALEPKWLSDSWNRKRLGFKLPK